METTENESSSNPANNTFGTSSDFHLSVHRVYGTNEIISGSQKTIIKLGGTMLALGFMIGF